MSSKSEKFNNSYNAFLNKGGSEYDAKMREIADEEGINYDLWHKQVYLESRFDPKAKSHTGVRGIGQFTKATGKAYGLETEEDFYNPEKSLRASARHVKDLVTTYKGDELKAMLAYNQGQGRSGKVSLDAYDSGNYEGMNAEGLQYIQLLGDKAKGGRETPAQQKASIVEKQELGLSQYEPTGSPEADNALDIPFGQKDPESSSGFNWGAGFRANGGYDLSITSTNTSGVFQAQNNVGNDQSPMDERDPTIKEEYLRTQDRVSTDGSYGWFEGVGKNLKNSWETSTIRTGMRLNSGRIDYEDSEGVRLLNGALSTSTNLSSKWESSDVERWADKGVPPDYYHMVARGTRREEEANIAVALENYKMRMDSSRASMSAQLVGGLADAAGDPISYTPMLAVKGLSLTGRVLYGAATGAGANIVSAKLNADVSGGTPDYVAVGGLGMAFGGAINGAFGKRPPVTSAVGQVLTRAEMNGLGDTFAGYVQNSVQTQQVRLENRMADTYEGIDPNVSGLPRTEGREFTESAIGDYTPLGNDGSVLLRNGDIMDGSNPYNPLAFERDSTPVRANASIPLGDLSAVGYSLNRSTDPQVLSLGSQLVRSNTGHQDGSSGIKVSTASDVHGRLSDRDNVTFRDMLNLREEAMGKGAFSIRQNIGDSGYEALDRKIVEALESGNTSSLGRAEKALLAKLQEFTDAKMSDMANPSRYGHRNAPAVLTDSRFFGKYYPTVWDSRAVDNMVRRFGRETMQDAVARSFIGKYLSDPAVKARVDDFLKGQDPDVDLSKAVDKYADSVAAGIVGNKHINNMAADTEVSGISGLRQNSFTETRHAFGNDFTVKIGSEDFTPNDLRVFNIGRVLPSYARRVNGDVAIHAGTGSSTSELVDALVKMKAERKGNGKGLTEVGYLEGVVKTLTGRSRADKAEGAGAAFLRSLNNSAYISKHAWFAAQELGEVAGMAVKGHLGLLFHRVPVLKEIVQKGRVAKLKDLQDAQTAIWGMEINNLLRPAKEDTIAAIRNAGSGEMASQVFGSIKYATQELAARMPLSRALPAVHNLIIESSRMGIMSDLVDHVVKGKKPSRFADFTDDKYLNAMSVTREQVEHVKTLVSNHFKLQPDGSIKFVDKEGFAQANASNDLWRMGDWAANEAVVRAERVSNQTSGHINPWLAMALQFKQFTMQAANSRTARGLHEAVSHGRAFETAMKTIIASGFAAGIYTMQKQGTALGLPEHRREKYLADTLSPEMITYGAITRSSQLAGLGYINIAGGVLGMDFAKNVRSTLLPTYAQDEDEGRTGAMKGNPLQDGRIIKHGQNILQQIPAAGIAGAAAQIGYNMVESTKDTGAQYDYNTGVGDGLKTLLPNDPATQWFTTQLLEEMGVSADF